MSFRVLPWSCVGFLTLALALLRALAVVPHAFFFFSSRRRHTRLVRDWSSDVCSSDLALPQVDYPTIQVLTFYPVASPDVMASSVTAPLERQFGQMPGLNQMMSTSSFGSSVITLQFALEQIGRASCRERVRSAGVVRPA